MKSKLIIIAALGSNRAIGIGNRLPWHLPEDMAFFHNKSIGKPVIMGRNTFISLGNKPLKQRYNIVVTDQDLAIEPTTGHLVPVRNLSDALRVAEAQHSPKIMICGGGQIYRQTLPLADEMYLTRIKIAPEADVFFPEFDENQWRKTILKTATSSNGLEYRFIRYTRK